MSGLFPDPDPRRYDVIPETTAPDLTPMAGRTSRALHAYWRDLAEGVGMPRAGDFSPMDIYRLAPSLLLLDVMRDADGRLRHRYRYVGTRIVEYRRLRGLGDHTGTFADAAPRYYSGAQLIESYMMCTKQAVPMLTMGIWQGSGVSGRFERLVLPLFDDDGAVSRLAACVDRFGDE